MGTAFFLKTKYQSLTIGKSGETNMESNLKMAFLWSGEIFKSVNQALAKPEAFLFLDRIKRPVFRMKNFGTDFAIFNRHDRIGWGFSISWPGHASGVDQPDAFFFFGDRKSTRLNSSHPTTSRMPSSA